MSGDKLGDHETCTSSPIASKFGYDSEHLPSDVLNSLHKNQTGTEISGDPIIARIQREQALVRDKRSKVK